MTTRSNPVPRAVLEGLAGGAAAGAFALAMERSPTFSVFADLLNAAFRILSRYLSEETLVRLDTEPVAFAVYVGGSALLGAALGAVLGAARRSGWGPNAGARAAILGLLLAVADAVLFGAVWRHRELSVVLGGAIVLTGGILGGGTARAMGALTAAVVSRWWTRILAGLLPAVVALSCAGTMIVARRGPPAPRGRTVSSPVRVETGQKVAILGVDGLDWPTIDTAVSQGRLPNLARLIREGTRGDLRSIRPPKSPVVWTSIATGMLPRDHGILDFVVRRNGVRIPVTGNLRRAHALWDLSDVCGYTAAFANWYVTWPAEPVAGAMISDRVDFDGLERRVFPEKLTAAVDSARARVDTRADRDIGRFTDLDGSFAGWRSGQWGQVRRALDILDGVVRHDLVTIETAKVALRDAQPDLTALYFRGNDNTQHLFWKYRFARQRTGALTGRIWPGLPEEDVAALYAVIDRYYDFVDEIVGEAIAMLEPDTAVLLLSDHGFLTNNERGRWYHANRVLAAAGLAELAPGDGGRALPESSILYDPQLPTVDRRRVLRAGARADDAAAAIARARATLEAVHTEDGPVFTSVEEGRDDAGPFLAVEFAASLAGGTAIVGSDTLPVLEFSVPEGHSGNHRMNGVLIAAGPPFPRGRRVEGARAVDIAPTVLHLLGAPAARDMEGVVLSRLLSPDWRAEHPVRYVRSFGRRTVDGDVLPTDADDRIREELQALGYIQ